MKYEIVIYVTSCVVDPFNRKIQRKGVGERRVVAVEEIVCSFISDRKNVNKIEPFTPFETKATYTNGKYGETLPEN